MRLHDIEIQSVKGDAFRLSFIADSPEVAMRVADRLASLFIGQTSLDRATLAEGTDQFLEAQLEDARRKVVENEARQEDYRRRHTGELPKQLEANVQGLHDTEMQMQVLADSLNRDRDRQVALERSLKDASLAGAIENSTPPPTAAPSTDASKLTAVQQLERAEATLKDMQSTLTEAHPDIVAMKKTVAEWRTRAAVESARRTASAEATAAERVRHSRVEELRTELSSVQSQIAQKTADGEGLRGALLTYQRRIEIEPTREAELAALTRDYDTLQETYRGLLTKKQESKIAANLERQKIGAQFKVLDPARMPERPFAPNRERLYAIAAFGALGIGLVFAVTIEWFDLGLRTEDEVRAALGLPVLAAVPLVAAARPNTRKTASVAALTLVLFSGAVALAWRWLK
jgi:uncharacterized protein involved in exopolysaccharide biosynthesis